MWCRTVVPKRGVTDPAPKRPLNDTCLTHVQTVFRTNAPKVPKTEKKREDSFSYIVDFRWHMHLALFHWPKGGVPNVVPERGEWHHILAFVE